MEKGSASAGGGGTVAMEISERAEPEESVRQRAASRDHRSLIVIGEIATELHLDAAKQQIAQGESGKGGVSERDQAGGTDQTTRDELFYLLINPHCLIISSSQWVVTFLFELLCTFHNISLIFLCFGKWLECVTKKCHFHLRFIITTIKIIIIFILLFNKMGASDDSLTCRMLTRRFESNQPWIINGWEIK